MEIDLVNLKGITVPTITVIVYVIITLLKQATNNNEKFSRFIPLIAVTLGIALGVLAYFTINNDMLLSNSLWAAFIVGGASGLAATGTNQIFKQLSKKDEKTKPE